MKKGRRINGGLAGKILRVDLSTGKIRTEESWHYAEKTLGGRGTNTLIMQNEIETGTKRDDPKTHH